MEMSGQTDNSFRLTRCRGRALRPRVFYESGHILVPLMASTLRTAAFTPCTKLTFDSQKEPKEA